MTLKVTIHETNDPNTRAYKTDFNIGAEKKPFVLKNGEGRCDQLDEHVLPQIAHKIIEGMKGIRGLSYAGLGHRGLTVTKVSQVDWKILDSQIAGLIARIGTIVTTKRVDIQEKPVPFSAAASAAA